MRLFFNLPGGGILACIAALCCLDKPAFSSPQQTVMLTNQHYRPVPPTRRIRTPVIVTNPPLLLAPSVTESNSAHVTEPSRDPQLTPRPQSSNIPDDIRRKVAELNRRIERGVDDDNPDNASPEDVEGTADKEDISDGNKSRRSAGGLSADERRTIHDSQAQQLWDLRELLGRLNRKEQDSPDSVDNSRRPYPKPTHPATPHDSSTDSGT